MKGLFEIDSPFFRFASKIGDLIILNVCFWLTSLPLFTIGISILSAETVGMDLSEKGRDGYVVKRYFKCFARYFKEATLLFLAELVIMGLAGTSLYICLKSPGVIGMLGIVASVFCIAILIFVLLTNTFLFTVKGRYDFKVKETIKISVFLAMKNLPVSLAVLAFPFLVIVGAYYIFAIRMIAFFIGFGICFFVNGFMRHLALDREPELKGLEKRID
ncbi:MAG: DUF624 domain-containing protein [Lachnospiraceae bacterium]